MKLFDMHIHAWGTRPEPDKLIQKMTEARVWGGCVMSYMPQKADSAKGLSFEERMEEVFGWVTGYEDRLFPILWIHPTEENLCEKIKEAVKRGICGFKIICNDMYVYEEAGMKALQTIAQCNVPVMFHSGILWDGTDSSKYNRPVNWEALGQIPGLRFSLAHCSWPWIDECYAVYGQFLNAQGHGNPAEMFLDTTPGTPEIYRKDLLNKLFAGGYDTGHNVMFGSDCFAHDYKPGWAKKWLKLDRTILEELGVSQENFENYYYHNVMRFLGKTAGVTHDIPVPDDAGGWSARNPEVPKIIEKWYRKLNFPKYFDEEFYASYREFPISDIIAADTYDITCKDGKRNLFSALYLCETLEKVYTEKGIDQQILLDTLQEIVTYTNIFSDLEGELSLGRMDWIQKILSGQIVRLGRLLFGFTTAKFEIPSKNIRVGDPVLQCYIPAGEKLTQEACLASIALAKQFFGESYTIVVTSWLLDDTLHQMLPPDSNIRDFQALFEVVSKEESDAILKFVFRWNTNRFNVKFLPAYNRFSEAVKQQILSGTVFYEVTGYLRG